MKSRIDCSILVAVSLLGAHQAFGGIAGQYTSTADTVFLYHFDEAAGNSVSASGITPLPANRSIYTIDGAVEISVDTSGYPVVTSMLGAASSLGFSKCADMGTTATLGMAVDFSGNGKIANQQGDATTMTHSSWMDAATGSFTMEALINVSSITANLPRTIISTDTDTGARGLSFKIASVPLVLGGPNVPSLVFDWQFAGGAVGSAGAVVAAAIPTAGGDPNAFVANEWFHVAAVYNNAGGIHTTTLYWTRLSTDRTQANAIGSGTTETITGSVVGPLSIGNEIRNACSESLRGKIDEVRITKGALGPTQFLFDSSVGEDGDGDGLPDLWELQYFQTKSRDGTGDFDTDGLIDSAEYAANTNPADDDSDDDGLKDGPETTGSSNAYSPGFATDPLDADTDNDGLNDSQENGSLNTGFGNAPTSPHNADTDFDSYSDYAEILYGTNPNLADTFPLPRPLIDNNLRNGSFELIGPEPGTPSLTRIPHWDTDPNGDITYWKIWTGVSTAENNSGAEPGSASHGAKHAYIQVNNAVYNLTDHVVAEGDILSFSFNHLNANATARVGLVYEVPPAEANPGIKLLAATEVVSTSAGNGKGLYYKVPPLSELIGRKVGIGIKSTLNFPWIDSVNLSIKGADADSDGLEDIWEDRYFGNNDGISTPEERALYTGTSQSPDNDGFDNLAEQAAGSDPTVAASTPNDLDSDGLPDQWEVQYFLNTAPLPGEDPDGDRDTNVVELANGTNPMAKGSFFSATDDSVPDSWKAFYGISAQTGASDLDEGIGDGSSNQEEFNRNTSPLDRDSDDDGLVDGDEIGAGTNPLDADTDDDGLSDGAEVHTHLSSPLLADTDGDSFSDKYEVDHATSPTNAAEFPTQPVGFTLLENFEGTGMTVGQTFNGVNGWYSQIPDATLVDADPAGGGNKVGHVNRAEPLRKSLATTGLQIRDGQTGTFFFQLYTGAATLDHSYGLSDVAAPVAFGDFEAQLVTINAAANFQVRDGGAARTITNTFHRLGEWMNVWIVANNATDTYKVYVESPFNQTGVVELTNFDGGVDPFSFRNSPGNPPVTAANALASFFMMENRAELTLPVYIDNLYVDPNAANLVNPVSVVNPDTDADGMPDAWEATYGLAIGTNDAATDLDKDGTSNQAEFRLGLIPNSGASSFKASANATTHQVTWQGVAGLSFTIQRSATLAAGSWSDVATVAGVDGANTWTDLSPLVGKAFYKVILNP